MRDPRRPETAVRAFTQAQRDVANCVTKQQLITPHSTGRPGALLSLRFVPGPASLRSSGGGPSGFLLDVWQQFAVAEASDHQWRVSSRMYEFRLLDHQQRELLVYHWQPTSEFRGQDHPHLHVSAALHAQVNAVTTRAYDLDKRHLATGHVSLAMIVHMLIEEFGIAPLRPDLQQVLDRHRQRVVIRNFQTRLKYI